MSNTESRDYFVRRHGMFFREGATGYVNGIGNAGRFTKADAGAFLDVEGVSVHRVSGYSERCDREIARLQAKLSRLKELRAHIDLIATPKDASVSPAQENPEPEHVRADGDEVLVPGDAREEWAQENLPLVGDMAELAAYLDGPQRWAGCVADTRSEEHTSERQSL